MLTFFFDCRGSAISNSNLLTTNTDGHNFNIQTITTFQSWQITVNYTKKSTVNSITIMNKLPDNIKQLKDNKTNIKKEISKYLLSYSFYYLNEFSELNFY